MIAFLNQACSKASNMNDIHEYLREHSAETQTVVRAMHAKKSI